MYSNSEIKYNNLGIGYINLPCAFDIETTSFLRPSDNPEPEKLGLMYEWTFGIGDKIIIGRTWEEFRTMLFVISNTLRLNRRKRLLCFVHNLAWEFQFMRRWFKWENVFSIQTRKPIYALCENYVEFRCSYLLSGYSLAKLAEQLTEHKIKKLMGDLDYTKIRHCKTPLTDDEIQYCINDVKIVLAYIEESIKRNKTIAQIPLTKTGYVRKFCRNMCFYEGGETKKKSRKRANYIQMMKGLRLTPEEYTELQEAFQGGFTHANPFKANKIIHNVVSFDFTSSYPAVMVAEKYPMSKSEVVPNISLNEFKESLKYYCCLFRIEFINLQSKLLFESYISRSRCQEIDSPCVENNGRIVSAKRLVTTITEQDFFIIQKFYTWDKFRVWDFRRYRKDYLPTDFVKAILTLYKSKTELKNVAGKEIEYLHGKEMLNSTYGMTVTNIARTVFDYTDRWEEPKEPDIEKAIKKYNNSSSRFLFYPWGVWICAYARRNLFTGILEFGRTGDYCYSDTDSIKVTNADAHAKYIADYNQIIRHQLLYAVHHHGLPDESIEPQTIKGVKKCLGVWDFDGHYSRFKTLGAKRYMVEYSRDKRNKENAGKFSITVSGLNKSITAPYLLDKYKDRVFDEFTDELYIPAGKTGKKTHTYFDYEISGEITDYLGITCKYRELSGINLSECDYSLKLSREYRNYIFEIMTEEGVPE